MLTCQQPKTGATYMQRTVEAEQRTARGERQHWCLTCDRWKFDDELQACAESRTLQSARQAALMDDVDTLPLFSGE
jgi:hypothetical protein